MSYYDTTTRGKIVEKDRIKLEVYVTLDPVSGVFSTKESARDIVDAILNDRIPHYQPSTFIAKE